jgi:hypothetical protein
VTIERGGTTGRVLLEVYGVDYAGNQTRQLHYIYLEDGPRVTPLVRVEGHVVDVNEQHVLYHADSAYYLHDRATGVATRTSLEEPYAYSPVFLTSLGAIGAIGGRVEEWRSGVAVDRGQIYDRLEVDETGEWATWVAPGAGGPGDLVLYHVPSAATQIVAFGASSADVTSDGTVVYADSGDIRRFRAGVYDTLYVDTFPDNFLGPVGFARYPATDGDIVAFNRLNPEFYGWALALYTPASVITLATPNGRDEPWYPGPRTRASGEANYMVADGWVAFTRLRSEYETSLWIRSPDGVEQLVSESGYHNEPDAMGPGGELYFTSFDVFGSVGRRYRWTPAGGVEDISTFEGRVELVGGEPFLLLGTTLFTIE